ncbi:MAG TPA: tetratricopeptide repeat protein [Myxococcota bacterium]|jgi:tetratricopeptide (TPR) repeat protein
MSERQRTLLSAAALLLMTAAAYAGVADCGFIWDDNLRVSENPTLRSLAGLRRIWFELASNKQYYPLVFTSFWLEYRLWGADPLGYHLVNLALHASGAVLLWRVLLALGAPGAWLAAAVFALHPVHVESVAWISERKNVLSGAFYLASALAYLRYAEAHERGSPRARRLWAASLALFLCALLAKTVACTLPAALLLALWWKHGLVARRDLRALAPFFALGIGLGLVTVWLERHAVGASGAPWNLSWLERGLIAGRALWFYLGKLAWPEPLVFVYPRWRIDAGAAWQYLFPLAALAVVAGLWQLRGRLGRGPLASGLFFAGTLLPALGFFDLYPMRFSFVADHFQYLASIGPIALAAAAASAGARRLPAPGRRAAWLGAALLLATLGALTARRIPVYEGLESLWLDTLEQNPGAHLAQYNLADLLRKRGETERAIRHFEAAIAAAPDLAMAHNNLAGVFAQQGKLEEATLHYRRAVEIQPGYALALGNLAELLMQRGEVEQAISHLREAVRAAPERADLKETLAIALAKAGRADEAHAHFVAARRLAREAAAAGR